MALIDKTAYFISGGFNSLYLRRFFTFAYLDPATYPAGSNQGKEEVVTIPLVNLKPFKEIRKLGDQPIKFSKRIDFLMPVIKFDSNGYLFGTVAAHTFIGNIE